MSEMTFVPKGVIPVLPIPFTENGAVNHEAYGTLIDYVIDHGVHAICMLDVEYSQMTLSERLSLMEFAAAHIHGRVPVIMDATRYSLSKTLEMTSCAQELGADAVIISPPRLNSESREEISGYYRAIAAHHPDLSIIPYSESGISVADGELDGFTSIPNIPFVISAGDLSSISLACRIQGCIMGIIPAVIPREIVRMHNLAKEKRCAEAGEMYAQLTRLLSCMAEEESPAPEKAILNMLGFDFGVPRLPIPPCSEALSAMIAEEMTSLGYTVSGSGCVKTGGKLNG